MAAVERHVDADAALRGAGLRARVFGGGGFASVALDDPARAPEAAALARSLGLEAWLRTAPPPGLRLGHPRYGDLVLLAPPGTAIARAEPERPAMRGAHGYRPEQPEMGALFVACGRGARPGLRIASVRAVDVAPSVLALLGIQAPAWMEGRPLPELAAPRAGRTAR
jgi:hypothetical protein